MARPMIDRRTLLLDNVTPQEIRAPRNGRAYLYIENHDVAKILYDEDTPSSLSYAGIEIAAAGNLLSIREWGQAGNDEGHGVPQGSIWLLGSAAGPQRVTVRQVAKPDR